MGGWIFVNRIYLSYSPKDISPPYLKIWLMEKDRKFPSIRCILRLEFCIYYGMWFFKKEKKTDLRAKRPGFLSSTHFGNWNNRQLFWASVSPSVKWSNGLWFPYCFPLPVLYGRCVPVWRGAHLDLNTLIEDKIGFQKWKFFLLF